MTILNQIIEYKKHFVKNCKATLSYASILQNVKPLQNTKPSFKTAIQNTHNLGQFAVIAEVKKASPSAGLIDKNASFDYMGIAKDYAAGGACCLSVLTDEKFFHGHHSYLTNIKKALPQVPLLRKDFIIDPYQIIEAKLIGADCILLIASCLDKNQLKELEAVATEYNLDVLCEVHDEAELDIALSNLQTSLIGINNRNLKTFTTDISLTSKLFNKASNGGKNIVVSESGINTKDDIAFINQNSGCKTFLIGTTLMNKQNKGEALKDLLTF
jgi:indole-3-glycerol phosphate synthase